MFVDGCFFLSFVHSQSDLLHQRKWATNGAARCGRQGQISPGNSYAHNTQTYSALCTVCTLTQSRPCKFIFSIACQ